MQPQLRAIDAYNAQESLVGWLRGFGVTTIHTGHGPGALVSGQTMIAKTRGTTVDEAVVLPLAMIASNLGPSALAEKEKSPGTRAKQMAMLRVRPHPGRRVPQEDRRRRRRPRGRRAISSSRRWLRSSTARSRCSSP